MPTARVTLERSLRRLGLLTATRTADAADLARGLETLQGLLDRLVGFGASWPVTTIRAESAIEIGRDAPAVRLLMPAGGVAVTLPKEPRDGARIAVVDVAGTFATQAATLLGQSNRIEGAAATLTLNTASLNRSWMFRADLGDWRRVSGLAADDDLPLPSEFDSPFAALLAVELHPEFGGELHPLTIQQGSDCRTMLAARYVPPLPLRPDDAVQAMGRSTNRRWW